MVKRQRTIDLARKVALLLLSLAVSGIAAEGLWRFVLSRGYGPPTTYDAILGWRFEPNTVSRHTSEDFDVEVHVDDAGRRVLAERVTESGRPTVVFVGDSFTFGWGVEAEDSFPHLIGRLLDADAVNLGVAGYGTDQEYLLLLEDGLPLGPEAVVLTFCHNDFEEVMAGRRYGWTKPRFHFEGERLVLSEAGARAPWLERRSLLYRSASLLLEQRSRAPLEGARLSAARRLVRHLIRSMAEESRRAGAKFLVLHAGDPWLGPALDEDGVPQVDVGGALSRAAAGAEPVIFASDHLHWNVRGHRAVAESLRSVLDGALSRSSALPAGR